MTLTGHPFVHEFKYLEELHSALRVRASVDLDDV